MHTLQCSSWTSLEYQDLQSQLRRTRKQFHSRWSRRQRNWNCRCSIYGGRVQRLLTSHRVSVNWFWKPKWTTSEPEIICTTCYSGTRSMISISRRFPHSLGWRLIGRIVLVLLWLTGSTAWIWNRMSIPMFIIRIAWIARYFTWRKNRCICGFWTNLCCFLRQRKIRRQNTRLSRFLESLIVGRLLRG